MKLSSKFYSIEVSEEDGATVTFNMDEINPLTKEKLELLIYCLQSCQEYLYD